MVVLGGVRSSETDRQNSELVVSNGAELARRGGSSSRGAVDPERPGRGGLRLPLPGPCSSPAAGHRKSILAIKALSRGRPAQCCRRLLVMLESCGDKPS